MDRVPTGSEPLDAALGGGLPAGSSILVQGPQGVGSTEFALTILRTIAVRGKGKAVFATALRSPARARLEAKALFDEKAAAAIRFDAIRPSQAQADCLQALASLGQGDALVIESTGALARGGSGQDVVGLAQTLGDAAQQMGCVVILLHSQGALSEDVEMSLGEAADGVMTFTWRDGGPTRRRSLALSKLRGLAPALAGEQVPVFDLALQYGLGFAISRVHTVV